MALSPIIQVESNSSCSQWIIKDITGLYSTPGNTGGWGIPNIVNITDVAAASIVITNVNTGSSYTFNVLTPVTSSVLTVSNPNITLVTINGTNIGNSTSNILDGYYTVVYTLTDFSDVDYTYTLNYVETCNTKCCTNKLIVKALDKLACNKCSCDDVKEALYARTMYLEAVRLLNECSKYTEANSMLQQAKKYCETKNCNCGCN